MWYLHFECSKHMIGRKEILTNFIEKYVGMVRFGNYHFSPIMGYGDVMRDNITIKKVLYVDNFAPRILRRFSVTTENGKTLLFGTRRSYLYTIDLSNLKIESPVCLLSKASMQQNLLWHRRFSHLNFENLNKLMSGYGWLKAYMSLNFRTNICTQRACCSRFMPKTNNIGSILSDELY